MIPSTVKSIGKSAFKQNISLTEIEYNAKNCADITSYSSDAPFKGAGSDHDNGLKITIGSAVTRIPKGLFLESAATELVFNGTSVSEIATYAFENCKKLKEINLPEGVTSIGSSSFKGCSVATRVVIPSTVKSIGSYAFQQNISLTEIEYNAKSCADITSYSSDAPFKGAGSDHDNGLKITIGSAVTRIPKGIFMETSATKLVFMGSKVTEIASYAFYNCTKLTDASISSSVSTIGKYAFKNCPFYK